MEFKLYFRNMCRALVYYDMQALLIYKKFRKKSIIFQYAIAIRETRMRIITARFEFWLKRNNILFENDSELYGASQLGELLLE